MKKLLSLLSILTISGSALPTVIASSPYEYKVNNNKNNNDEIVFESLNRKKREYNDDRNEFEYSGGFLGTNPQIWTSFKPNFWEKIIYIYFNKNSDFVKLFEEECTNQKVWTSSGIMKNNGLASVNDFQKVAFSIKKNWNTINSIWNQSNRTQRIRIGFKKNSTCGRAICISGPVDFISANIRTDERTYHNNLLNNLWIAFNGDLGKYQNIYLGLIENDNNNTILNKLKELYPSLDISQLEIVNKKSSFIFDKKFVVDIEVKKTSNIYSLESLRKKFTFHSKKYFLELSKKIEQELLVKNWLSEFNTWKQEQNRQWKNDYPYFYQAQKRTWKGNFKTEFNQRIISLSHILETIENKFKITELYNNFVEIKKDIEGLKQDISNLKNRVADLETISHSGRCGTVTSGVSTATNIITSVKKITNISKYIPVYGEIISNVFSGIAAICYLVNDFS